MLPGNTFVVTIQSQVVYTHLEHVIQLTETEAWTELNMRKHPTYFISSPIIKHGSVTFQFVDKLVSSECRRWSSWCSNQHWKPPKGTTHEAEISTGFCNWKLMLFLFIYSFIFLTLLGMFLVPGCESGNADAFVEQVGFQGCVIIHHGEHSIALIMSFGKKD